MPKRKKNRNGGLRPVAAGVLLACVWAVGAGAGEANYQPYVVGERAAGMGGAVVATADGMDACFYNPAGLAGESSDSLSVNGTLYGIQTLETRDASFPGEDFNISAFTTIPTGLSAVRRLKPGTAAAFSVFVPSQAGAREIQAFENNQHYYNYSWDEQTLRLGPSFGHALNERLSLGASLFGVYRTASLFQNLYWGDYSYSYAINYKYSALGAIGTLGLQYRLAEAWSAGLAVTTPSAILSGSGRIQAGAVIADEEVAGAEAAYYEDLDADNGLPAQVRAGIGWRRPGRGGFEFDVTHHFQRDFDWMKGTEAGETIVFRRERRATTDVQAGCELILGRRFPLRAGGFTSLSAAPDLDPEDVSTPQQIDLYGVTVGTGLIGSNVVLNIGLSYVWGAGDAYGVSLTDAGELETIISETTETGLYAFAGTSYRF